MDIIDEFIEDAKPSNEPKEKSGIFELNNQYFVRKTDENGQSQTRRLTNFTIKIISSHYREGGILREIEFHHTNGKVSDRILIEPEKMYESFKPFLAKHGNHFWWGTVTDLTNLWYYLSQRDTGKVVHEPECIGWQKDTSLYMFGNITYLNDTTLSPDEYGTFWHKGKGIKPRSLNGDSTEGIPYINTEDLIDFNDLRQKLNDSMDEVMAGQCLGWCVSVLFMEEIFAKYKQFPFLFITGKRRSGKSTIAQWLTYLFGFSQAGRMWSDTTPVAMGRYLSYYSALPVWLDEYRNDPKYNKHTSMLRNIFNRQSSGKGMRESFGVREPIIRGTVIVSGEETPNDNALLTRCIVINMEERKRKATANHFNWFNDNQENLSNFTHTILINKHKHVEKLLADIEANKLVLSQKYDDRLSTNKAIIAAGFSLIYGEDKEFARALMENTRVENETQEEESAVSVFFNDIGALVFSKTISPNYWAEREGYLYIYFHGLYNEWAIDYRKRRGEPPFKLQSLRGYLAEEKGFVSLGVNCRMDDNSVRSCVKFHLEDCEEYIKQIAQKNTLKPNT